mmetsp:Transcript_59907/g.129910  ORF Transcript_59907/g.129910 Transcript_59907/m.129910 type:complete len:252 (+) Transcript_59907:1373-2128(+)
MSDAFDGVLLTMREIIQGVHAPLVARAVMRLVQDPIDGRVTHVHVRVRHVNLGPQEMRTFGVLPVAHLPEKSKVFLGRAIPEAAVGAGGGQRTSVGLHLRSSLRVHVSLAIFDEQFRPLVELIKVARSEVEMLSPAEAQPSHVLHDTLHIFRLLRRGVGVVEAKVAPALVHLSEAEVDANRLAMPYVQVTIWLRRKTRADNITMPADPGVAPATRGEISVDDFLQKIFGTASSNDTGRPLGSPSTRGNGLG